MEDLAPVGEQRPLPHKHLARATAVPAIHLTQNGRFPSTSPPHNQRNGRFPINDLRFSIDDWERPSLYHTQTEKNTNGERPFPLPIRSILKSAVAIYGRFPKTVLPTGGQEG